MSSVLLPYQQAWVTNDAPFSIYLKARRIGISWAEALWSVRRRLTKKIDHWFVSTDSKTSIEFIRYCKLWAEIANTATQSEVVDIAGATTECLTFPNGSRIFALSSNPDAMRGKGGDVTLDEFAFHEWAETLYTAAQPVRQWGGVLRIISTQNGPTTAFYRLCEEAKAGTNGFKYFKTDLVDAVREGLAEKVPGVHQEQPTPEERDKAFIDLIRKTSWSESSFLQEYMCEASTDETILTPEEYDNCVLPGFSIPEIPDFKAKYGPLYVGIDVGRSKNYTVLWAIERGIDKKAPPHLQVCYRTIAIKALRGMSFQNQFEVIDSFIGHRAIYKVCIDAGGIGMQLAEDLKAKHGNRVEQFHIGHKSKATIVERVKKFVAQQRVSVPNDGNIRNDLCSMKRIAMKSGGHTYDGQSGDSHCDYFLALAMALEAAEQSVRVTAWSNNTIQDTNEEKASHVQVS